MTLPFPLAHLRAASPDCWWGARSLGEPRPARRGAGPAALIALPLLLFGIPSPAVAQAEGGATGAAGRARDAETAATMVAHVGRQVGTLADKLEKLARAMPEETYDWRPMKGVRSVGEVYAHVAGDNYFVAALLGLEVPEESGVTTDGATVGAYEEKTHGKEAILAGLTHSFQVMREALANVEDDPSREISLRGNSLTAGDLYVRATTHLHEHLGQAIAYARMNRVVPPWSR
ncbi:MAG: DinB family protein [Gemmatimonadota bacterium]